MEIRDSECARMLAFCSSLYLPGLIREQSVFTRVTQGAVCVYRVTQGAVCVTGLLKEQSVLTGLVKMFYSLLR